MANETGMTLQVSPDLVRPVIEHKIHAAIIEALSQTGVNVILDQTIARVLAQKVNSEGKVDNYEHYNKTPYVEYVCGQMIRDAVRSALKSWIENNQPLIDKQVDAEFKKRSKFLAQQFAAGMLDCVKTSWGIKCDVTFQSQDK